MCFLILKRSGGVWRDQFLSFLRESSRFLIPLFIVLCAKLTGSFFLYHGLNIELSDTFWMTVWRGYEGENETLRSRVNWGARWSYLFLGWDSAWYLSIVVKGYAFSDQSYAFFPGLPLFGGFLNLIFQNSILALVAFSAFVGILWVPVYQLVAENYLDKSKALKSTLFYALFPYVFLFTTVVYSEGLFLFSTLGAWYFFKREKILFAMVFASIATISRPPGLLILLPILIEIVQTYAHQGSSLRRRHILYLVIPFLCFFAWLLYCKITVNDWFAPFNRSAWNMMYSLRVFVFNILLGRGIQVQFENFQVWPFSFAWILFLLISLILIRALIRMDKALALYSVAYFLGILAFGALASVPRFISFLYPIWLPLTTKLFQGKQSNLVTLIICVSFYLTGLYLWMGFLNGEFVS